jgi:hypothetical protein
MQPAIVQQQQSNRFFYQHTNAFISLVLQLYQQLPQYPYSKLKRADRFGITFTKI